MTADTKNPWKVSMRRVGGLVWGSVVVSTSVLAQTDPGPRAGHPAAGGPIAGLTEQQASYFAEGRASFQEVASVTGSVPDTEPGLGPRFNLTNCAGCHAHPAVGGSSPALNPQFSVAPPTQTRVLLALGIISPDGGGFHFGPVKKRLVPYRGVTANADDQRRTRGTAETRQ
jgi:mono/diheme cytochrome c family protein